MQLRLLTVYNCTIENKKQNCNHEGLAMKVEAYCVKCRKKVEMKDAKEVKLKNGKPAMKGTCPKCGTGVFRIGKPKS